MTAMLKADQIIDEYVADVQHLLRGPRSAKRAILDEIDDHLREAASGPPGRETEAALRATEAFGDPKTVADRMQPDVTRQHLIRASLNLLLAASSIGAMWVIVLVTGPNAPWSEHVEPHALVWTDATGSAAIAATLLFAALAIGASYLLPRLQSIDASGARRFSARSCAIGGGLLAVGVASILTYVGIRGALAPRSIEWSDVTLSACASLVAVAIVAVKIRSALRTCW